MSDRAARLAAAPRRALCASVLLWLVDCAAAPGPADAEPVRPATDAGATLASVCSGCHRAGGQAIVDLQTYSAEQIEQLLRAYKQAEAGPTAMHRMARGYSDAEIAAIAEHLGR